MNMRKVRRTVGGSSPAGSGINWSGIDGSAAAAGGAAQHSTYLNGYTARPPWQVAGIDYGVGPHSGTSFADPRGDGRYNGATHVFRPDGPNQTLDGYDFTLDNGINIYCPDQNGLTIKNCKFGGTNYPGLSTGVIDFRGQNLTFEYNQVDGGATGGADAQATLIYIGTTASGTISIRYNWLKNYPQQIIELLTGLTLTMKYNLIDQCLVATGAHMNWLQQDPATGTFNLDVEFNTGYQNAGGGAEGFQFYSSAAATLASPICRYNTLIATGAGAMTNIIHGSNDHGTTTLSGTPIMASNYFDKTGATNAFYPVSITSGWSVTGNKNMSNGKTIAADNTET